MPSIGGVFNFILLIFFILKRPLKILLDSAIGKISKNPKSAFLWRIFRKNPNLPKLRRIASPNRILPNIVQQIIFGFPKILKTGSVKLLLNLDWLVQTSCVQGY